MIKVELAKAPKDFKEKVRLPGLRSICEKIGKSHLSKNQVRKLMGKDPLPDDAAKVPYKNKGPTSAFVCHKAKDIPTNKLNPYWRDALPDLMDAYHRRCAYTSFYIERVMGSPTVDHMVPKASSWTKVYRWNNYRLACHRVNTTKGTKDVLDPFEIEDDWFELDLVFFQALPADHLKKDPNQQQLVCEIQRTIDHLGLNSEDCLTFRKELYLYYYNKEISFSHLRKRCLFLAREMERQNWLQQCRVPSSTTI